MKKITRATNNAIDHERNNSPGAPAHQSKSKNKRKRKKKKKKDKDELKH